MIAGFRFLLGKLNVYLTYKLYDYMAYLRSSLVFIHFIFYFESHPNQTKRFHLVNHTFNL